MGKICSPIRFQLPISLPEYRHMVWQFVVVLSILVLLVSPDLYAQDATPETAPETTGSSSTSGIGINAVMSHQPQEEGLSDIGGKEEIDKFEVYFDWDWLRIGYNMTHASLDFAAYNRAWQTRLKKDTTYAAYRISSAGTQSKWDLFLLAGLAYTEASFTITEVSSHSSTDLGYVTGGGAFYRMGIFDMGLQLLVISTAGDFDGIKIATGSTQWLYGLKLNF